MITARKAAFDALMKVAGGGYSNLSLDAILSGAPLSPRDKALSAALFYGVLENQMMLDYIIDANLSKKNVKIEKKVRVILEMGVYQLVFMDKIPDSAAVNESVTLAKSCGLSRASGFINAVLRSFLRNGKRTELPPKDTDTVLYLSLRYSVPRWLIEKWCAEYGSEICEDVLSSFSGRPPLFVRINTQRADFEALAKELSKDNVKCEKVSWLRDAAVLSDTGDIEKLSAYKKGLFHVQDAASQFCCTVIDVHDGDTVCDVCAAPGGKTFTLAQMCGERGHIFSHDIYPQKTEIIASGARRLGLSTRISVSVRDAAKGECGKKTQKVLCDVPCSGLGIIRRKPDIKNKRPENIDGLPEIQYSILANSAKLVDDGGVLVYSTCTLSRAENGDVIDKFLSENDDFEPFPFEAPCERICGEPGHMLTLFPDMLGTDGFFIARIRKKVSDN